MPILSKQLFIWLHKRLSISLPISILGQMPGVILAENREFYIISEDESFYIQQ